MGCGMDNSDISQKNSPIKELKNFEIAQEENGESKMPNLNSRKLKKTEIYNNLSKTSHRFKYFK